MYLTGTFSSVGLLSVSQAVAMGEGKQRLVAMEKTSVIIVRLAKVIVQPDVQITDGGHLTCKTYQVIIT